MLTTIATLKAEGAKNGTLAAENGENTTVVEVNQVIADTVTYEFRLRLRDMNRAMKLDIDQIEALQLVNRELTRSIAKLEKVPAKAQQERLNNIIAKNLLEVRAHVDEAQYRAYLGLLNSEFNKAGLTNILYGYEVADNR